MLVSKFKLFAVIAALCWLLPNIALANGVYSSRESTGLIYKQANVFLKMPDYMYVNDHGGNTPTVPSIFFNIENSSPAEGYNSMDIGLRYKDNGWGVEFFGTSTVVNGAHFTIEVPGRPLETHIVGIGDGYSSSTYGHSDPIFNYVPNQILQLNAYFTTRTIAGITDWVLRYEVYDNFSTLKVRADIPVKGSWAQTVNNSGARWSRVIALATNGATAHYINDGTYLYNAQYQNGWLVGTDGVWRAWNNSISPALLEKFEEGQTVTVLSDSHPYAGKIATYNQTSGSYNHDFVNIHYDQPQSGNTFSYSASNTNSAQQNTSNRSIALSAGQKLTLGTCGVTGSSFSGDTYLRLYGPGGIHIVASDDACGGAGSHFEYTVPAGAGGNYELRAGCYSSNSCSGTVAWTISGGATGDSSGTRSFNTSNTNSAQQNTTNQNITASSGQLITVGTCNMTGASASGDTYIRLYGPGGAQVTYNDDACGVASKLMYTVPAGAGGTYQIRIGCYGSGSCSGTAAWTVQ